MIYLQKGLFLQSINLSGKFEQQIIKLTKSYRHFPQ